MLKIERLIIVVVLVLFLAAVRLFFMAKFKNEETFPSETFQNGIDKDFEDRGVVKEIEGSLFKITLTGGGDKDYLLMNQVVYLCLPVDEDYYNYLKDYDRDNLDSAYLIKREDVPGRVKVGGKVELFLFEYSPDKIFIKGIADLDC
jgi:hypothetical protein